MSTAPAKRQRVAAAKDVQLLTCVEVVVRTIPSLSACRELCMRIEEFVDGPKRWEMIPTKAHWSVWFALVDSNSFEFHAQVALEKGMLVAAERGFLHVTKWLHTYFPSRYNLKPEIFSAVMDTAASNGYLDIVQFLHHNRDEGCTHRAMDGAACNGYFKVIKWLYENRNEGCSREAFDGALLRQDLPILKYLHERYGNAIGLTTGSPIPLSTRQCSLELYKWLEEHYADVMDAMPHIDPPEYIGGQPLDFNAIMASLERDGIFEMPPVSPLPDEDEDL